jgi:hypothetical protein
MWEAILPGRDRGWSYPGDGRRLPPDDVNRTHPGSSVPFAPAPGRRQARRKPPCPPARALSRVSVTGAGGWFFRRSSPAGQIEKRNPGRLPSVGPEPKPLGVPSLNRRDVRWQSELTLVWMQATW